MATQAPARRRRLPAISFPQLSVSLDPTIHEPARLRILTLLHHSGATAFTVVRETCGLTAGNLMCHVTRLQRAGLVAIRKQNQIESRKTTITLTRTGAKALDLYQRNWRRLTGT